MCNAGSCVAAVGYRDSPQIQSMVPKRARTPGVVEPEGLKTAVNCCDYAVFRRLLDQAA